MKIRLYFMELPANSALAALDRKLDNMAKAQESIEGGRRLWISHVPETAMRPFLNAKPFDLLVSPMRFSDSQLEEYRMGLGSAPKRCMTCHVYENTQDVYDVLFSLVAEILSCTGALLCIDEYVGAAMFGRDKLEDVFTAQQLEGYPGSVFEVAHENTDGDLSFEWFVDSRWLRAWMLNKRKKYSTASNSTGSRFASLDYS